MTHRSPRRRLACSLAAGLAVCLGAPSPSRAQQPRAQDRGATDGVDRVIHDYSGEGDASSLELNPALLSDIRGLDITLLGYGATSDFVRGTGFGGFFGFGSPFLATAFGVQVVRPRLDDSVADFAAPVMPDVTKLSWALSAGMGEHGAIGFGISGIRQGGVWLQRPDLDLGTLVRLYNFASLGVAARFSPSDLSSGTLPSVFSVTGELAVRPLGTHHIEVAGGLSQQVLTAAVGDPLDNPGLSGLLPRGRVALRYQGLALKGEVEQVSTSVLDPTTLDRLTGEKAVRGSVALEAAWDFAKVGAGIHAGVSESGLDGVGVMARFTTRRQGRAFWPRRVDAERIDVSSVRDERDLIEMLQRLERARLAGPRSVLVIDARRTSLGWASLHEIRDALVKVRGAGGHVFAYLEGASTKDYYLASVAEKVYVHPAGGLSIHGLSSTSQYFRGSLDKIGVQAEVIRVKEYKSAGERFTNVEPSKEDREQRTELMADTYGRLVYDIARGRQKSLAQVRGAIEGAPYEPDRAVELGLVDDIVHRDELAPAISDVLGAQVEFHKFADTNADETWDTAPYVAVVLVEGTIVDGKSRSIPIFNLKFAGGDTIAQTLRDVRDDRACRGIILRVNSPGGSALASDIIWREVSRTHEAFEADPKFNPPIIVSMGDVAASGGYYVSMGAPFVLADPMTITGSIGVISLHFDVSGLLGKLGISTTTFKTTDTADIGSFYRPYSEEEKRRLDKSIHSTYDLFRSRVAEGRGMTMEQVDEVGRGHVWSGEDAMARGLVDGYGGLYDAIGEIRERAGIRKFRKLKIRVLPKSRGLLDLILQDTTEPFGNTGPVRKAHERRKARRSGGALAQAIPAALSEALAKLPLSLLFLPQGQAQAILPAHIEID